MSRFQQNLRLFLKVISLVAVLLVINLAVAQWDVEWDMTKSGLYTLTDTTRGVLADLDRDVELILFHADQSNQRSPVEPLWVRTLLRQYDQQSDRVSFREINHQARPGVAREHGVRQNHTVIVKIGDRSERIQPFDLVNMRRRGENTFLGERAVTRALKNLTSVTDRTVWFATGHGERSPRSGGSRGRSVSSFRSALQDAGLTVDSFNPLNDEWPSNRDLILVLDPQSTWSEDIGDRLLEWNNNGGSVLVAGSAAHRGAANSVLAPVDVEFEDRQILGQNWQFFYSTRGNPFLLTPSMTSHPVTEPLQSEGLSVMLGRSMPITADTSTYRKILESGEESYAKPIRNNRREIDPRFDEAEDVRGPFSVAVVDGGSDTRGKRVVISNADFISDSLFDQAGNRDLAINLVNWILEREIALGIEPVSLAQNTVKNITPTQAYVIQMISLVAIPFSVLIWGGVVWWKRRNL